jgi:hypothetical protein
VVDVEKLEPEDRAADDEVVIDLTDAAMAKQALYDRLVSTSPSGELIIDLRDEVLESIALLAPTGRELTTPPMPSGRPPSLQEGLELVVIEDGPEWAQAEAFVYDCYVKLGYTEENRDHEVAELRRYRDRSRFHAAVNQQGDIVGTTRAIFGEFHELPVGRFTRIDFADEDPMCELSSIVVEPGSRNQGVIEHLYREGWADAFRTGCPTIAGLGERWMIDGFRNYYCLPFVPCGIPEWYMGGEVIPMTMTMALSGMEQVYLHNPEFFWWNIERLSDEDIDRVGCRHLTREAVLGANAD